jgi:hypothetical protein
MSRAGQAARFLTGRDYSKLVELPFRYTAAAHSAPSIVL